MPTLFVGVGACAQATLAQFARMAQSLAAPIHGPFGLVLADSPGEGLFVCDWPYASAFRCPEPAAIRANSEFVGGDAEKSAALLSSLVRRLRAMEPGADPGPGSRIRMSAYVAIDLSDRAAVASSLRLMRVLRQVDTAVDTTVVGLTARTAANGSADGNAWFETWKLLLEQLGDGPSAQRVYLLDGCDTDKTWCERPEQLHRLGAEFLFYHGLTCRGLLRQNERARTGAHESLLNVCGSFGCRTIEADLAVVAERVAERLAREDLADLYRRTVPSSWLARLQEQSRLLADWIAALCERTYQARGSSAGAGRDRPDARQVENMEIMEAIRKTVQHVCSREPLISLCLFFQLLRPKLARLLSQQRLWERARTRQMVVQTFHQHQETTYKPMRIWLSRPQTQWVDRFTPAQEPAAEVAVSRPASLKGYIAGGLILAAGLVGVAIGIASDSRLLAAGGGLVAVIASLLMTLPTGWTLHSRNRLREGQDTEARVPEVLYRKRASGRTRLVCTALIFLGLAGVTWPLWPQGWTLAAGIWAAILAVLIVAGIALVAGGPSEARPDQIGVEEAPGHVNPPAWRYRVAGVLCLALAWVVLGLGTPEQEAAGTIVQWLARLTGLALVAGGAGVALFPRVGCTRLIDRVGKIPVPLAGGIAHPVRERELPPGVTALAAWVNRLALEPDQCLERFTATDARHGRENLLDFVATDWEGQLARAFRQTVEAKSGRSLKSLALQPALWAEGVTRQLQNPHEGSCELTSLFALQAVKAWIESHTLAELLSLLDIDPARFGRLAGRLACVHWPTPRVDPDMNASVIAVGKPLWDALAAQEGKKVAAEGGRSDARDFLRSSLLPSLPSSSGASLVLLDWDVRDDKIVVLHGVQGLTQGWRGFPGMPGQLHEQSRTTTVPA